MTNSNVQMWFAKNENGEIVTINGVDKSLKEKYYCPICGSEVVPRQGQINDWCFAHIDKSKCNIESIYHFWFKNKLIEKGTKFVVETDQDLEFACEDILIEESYEVNGKKYKPDLTVLTSRGEKIYFEMDYTNKKKIEDYIGIWNVLDNIVIEIDTKTLMSFNNCKLPKLKALYYKGKIFNVKEDKIYKKEINDFKERIIKDNKEEKFKKDLEKLDWLWRDIKNYKMGLKNIEEISELIQSIEEDDSRKIVVDILRKTSCSNIIKDYIQSIKLKINNYIENLNINFDEKITYKILVPRKIYDRLYESLTVNLKYKELQIENVNAKNIFNYSEDYIKIREKEHESRLKEYERKKEIFNNFINYKLPYDYSYLCTNLHTSGFPNLNYYSSYYCEDRIYLNNFKNSRNEFILVHNCNKYEDVEKFILDKLGKEEDYGMFSKTDFMFINETCGKLKEKFNNIHIELTYGKHIKFSLNIPNYSLVEILHLKKDEFNLNNLYDLVSLKVNEIMYKIENNKMKFDVCKNIVKNLNKKYKLVNGNWTFKISGDERWLDPSVIFYILKEKRIQIKCENDDIIEKYFNNNIKDDEMETLLKIKISNYIREYIYGKK